ncbi:MAG: SHOCT domain-containing protein, partial [Solirubrobacterales bacterium]|nr:SHOCT domain-containing protein [Solirubrobacterales bacterium]
QTVASYGIVLGIMVLVFIWNPIPSTGKPLGILVFTLLALWGTYLLIAQTTREFPEARSGAATHAIKTRIAGLRRPHHAGPGNSPPASGATTAEQLKQLADLRDHGAITPEEYQTAKTKLLSDQP